MTGSDAGRPPGLVPERLAPSHRRARGPADQVPPSGRAVLERLVDPRRPAMSVARLAEHARRMDRAAVLDPFLRDGDSALAADRVAEALSVVRWWR